MTRTLSIRGIGRLRLKSLVMLMLLSGFLLLCVMKFADIAYFFVVHHKRLWIRRGENDDDICSLAANQHGNDQHSSDCVMDMIDRSGYASQLAKYASKDKNIILAFVDIGFIDMVINFYLTSLKRHQISNFLFVANDLMSCQELSKMNLQCHTMLQIPSSADASDFKSHSFNRKMNARTYGMLIALQLGYSVLHTDVDVVFLNNPLPLLQNEECPENSCDVAVLWDTDTYNAGFIYVRATSNSVKLYDRMRWITGLSGILDDQLTLNTILRYQVHHGTQLRKLPETQYMSGFKYFEEGDRLFAEENPCKNCVVLHNNWIISKSAKRYRFQEAQMWWYDLDRRYSDTSTKYLTYHNTPPTGEQMSWDSQINDLKMALALGFILKRSVILPRFHCYQEKSSFLWFHRTEHYECPLNSLLDMTTFDSQFYRSYRESEFLQSDLVPNIIKEKILQVTFISNEDQDVDTRAAGDRINVYKSAGKVPSVSDILKLEQEAVSVLDIENLSGLYSNMQFSTSSEWQSFLEKLESGFLRNTYEQRLR